MSNNGSLDSVVARILFKNRLPESKYPSWLVEDWRGFVDYCESGYGFSKAEFDNDVRIREWLQVFLDDPDFRNLPEYATILQEVEGIDKGLKNITQHYIDNGCKRFWWENIILKYGRPMYVEDIYAQYGIEIEVVPSPPPL